MARKVMTGGRTLRRPGLRAAMLSLAAAAALGALSPESLAALQCPDGTPPPCAAARPARGPAAAAAPTSVAVLYFDNQSRDTSDAYLADGLTEEITSRLTKIGRLVVTSHTTMERYRGSGRPEPQALARALRVAHLVNGSVRRSGSRVRVSVELLRPRDGVQVWADTYDRTDADLLAIEADVARAVATAIAGRLLPGEQAGLESEPTRNPVAHDLYLRGTFLLARRTPQDVARAIGAYQEAARADSAFAHAYARVALGWALYLDWGWPWAGQTRESMLALGFRAADRALQLDSGDAEGWMSRAYLLMFRNPRTFEGVLPAFERAIQLEPRNAEVLHQYASALSILGDDEGAIRWSRRALEVEPERPISFYLMVNVLHHVRRFEQAAALADSAIALDPQFYPALFDRARVRWRLGDRAGARADAEAARRASPAGAEFWGQSVVAMVDAWSGDTAAARAALAPALAGLEGRAELPDREGVDVALALVALGERTRALDVLERIRPRGAVLLYWLREPEFDALRDDPRFRHLSEDAQPPSVR
jgi:TolB-like protein